MSKSKARVIAAAAVALLVVVIFLVWTSGSAKADGSPVDETVVTDPAVTDPCFREDIECYEQTEVECADNVFVPLNADGTWTCPDVYSPQVIPPGTRPGPDQVSPGGSHPFIDWNGLWDWFFHYVMRLHPAEPDFDDPRVQQQLPEERIGRVFVDENGLTCVIVNAEGYTDCNLPDIPGTPPIALGN